MPDVGDPSLPARVRHVETVKAVNSLYSPVEGEVVEVHGSLEEKPDPITADPLGDGWIVKIRVEKTSALDHLLSPAAYKRQVEKEAHSKSFQPQMNTDKGRIESKPYLSHLCSSVFICVFICG